MLIDGEGIVSPAIPSAGTTHVPQDLEKVSQLHVLFWSLSGKMYLSHLLAKVALLQEQGFTIVYSKCQ